MAKYQKYAEYQDSGVKWLGLIPKHWSSCLFKRVIANIKDGTHGTHARVENGELLLSAKNVFNSGIVIGENESYIPVKDYEEITRNGFPKKGDILVTCVGTIGRSFVYPFDKSLAFQRSVSFMRLNNKGYPQFYKYFIDSKAYQSQLESLVKSSAQGGIYMGDLINTVVINCPIVEQVKIANFLDHETARIDTLIAKQEKLIELLKEKRQAVISHAVTKGLNPNVAMKNSGVEWMGETPIHWQATYVGIVSDVIDPQPDHRAPAISENGEGFPYIGIRDVNKDGTLNFETARPVEESAVRKQEHSFTIEPHNIIFCKVGTLGLPRKIIPHGRCALSATLVLIKAKKINSQFLLYALDSDCIISQTNFLATGSTRAALGIQQIRKFRIPLPSVSDQLAISSFLDHQVAQIDTLIIKAQSAIQLMQERRTALISAAVTGKIDVRNWQSPNTNNEADMELIV